jgi:hypothetical protein
MLELSSIMTRLFYLSSLALCFAMLCVSVSPVFAVDTAVASSTKGVAAPALVPPKPPTSTPAATEPEPRATEEAWDYSPYRVRIWVSSSDDRISAAQVAAPLEEFLDRSFSSIWRLSISDAPPAVRAAARRDFASINYKSITAADPVLAIKRDHPEAPRIRVAADVATYVKKCFTTPDRLASVKRQGALVGNPTLDGTAKIFETIIGDAYAVADKWKDESVEGVLLSRGMAAELTSPEAKIVRLPIDNLVAEDVEANDKIFIVHVNCESMPLRVEVVELDCLMRHFSPVLSRQSLDFTSLPTVMGQAVIDSFAPIVRVEDAGQKTAYGLLRAAGLAIDKNNPALIREGEFLQPMVRKNDRNGSPIAVGPLPWAFLHVTKVDGARVDMDLYAGQIGGLQGRKNNRTFRHALRTRAVGESSTIRLHAQGNPKEPLVGYEIYEKELKSINMTLVGRTNWDGKIEIGKTETDKRDATMRLLYVKNGGAVLARLPIVPGLLPLEVADLVGDDQRLRAEAYIRGTQNAIVDLIAIRTLLGARIHLRLEQGRLAEAKELLDALREEPSYDTIANDMGKKVTQIKGRNASEQKKIDQMFAQTREMLVNNINSKLIRDLETEVIAAEANGGTLKRKPAADDKAAAN